MGSGADAIYMDDVMATSEAAAKVALIDKVEHEEDVIESLNFDDMSPHVSVIGDDEPSESKAIRAEVLDKAKQAVLSDRNKSYGEPEDNLSTIASLWQSYLDELTDYGWSALKMNGVHVSNLLILMKVARAMNNPTHLDNWVDMAGYASCGASCANEGA